MSGMELSQETFLFMERLHKFLYHFKNQFPWGKNNYEVETSSIIFLRCNIRAYLKIEIRSSSFSGTTWFLFCFVPVKSSHC